ncbi:MAG TPA: SRPBCC family protein [Chloroflexota bacterium]|nr:SRPBCC family protein [Chloroflexota bacterium]
MTMRMARTAQADTWIAAPPERVWEVVGDIGRAGEWSGESLGSEWLDSVAGPVPGARFKGRNKRHLMRWTRVSRVLTADPPLEFAWETEPTALYPDSTEWHIRLAPESGGTRVTEEMRIIKIPRPMEIGIYWLIREHRDRHEDLVRDLERLKSLVEAEDRGETGTGNGPGPGALNV